MKVAKLPPQYWPGWEFQTKDGKIYRFNAPAGLFTGEELVIMIAEKELGYSRDDITEITMYFNTRKGRILPTVFPNKEAIHLGAFLPQKDENGKLIGYTKVTQEE